MKVDLDWLENEIVVALVYQYPDPADRNRRIVAIVEGLSDLAHKHGATMLAMAILVDLRTLYETLKTADLPLPKGMIQ